MHITRVRAGLVAILLAVAALRAGAEAAPPFQGFGATTRGGAGGTVVRVTTLADSGPGSLREALRKGDRTIVFDVAGEIALHSYLPVLGAFVTIDGSTAPSPGITLRNHGLVIRGSRGAHDVVVRGLRVRSSSIDGIQVSGGAYNVVIDHVSVDGSGDGNIDITEDSRDVTVSWSLLSGTGKNMLIKYKASRVTLHHNIFIGNSSRNPQARVDDEGGVARDLTLDMRGNLVWGFASYGTLVWEGAWANVVGNYYGSSRHAIQVDSARAYVAGNQAADGTEINRVGTQSVPFDAPAVTGETACAAARSALESAGVRPVDSLDQHWLRGLDLDGCPDAPATLAASPAALAFTVAAGASAPPQAVQVLGPLPGAWTARPLTGTGHWLSVTPASGSAPGVVSVTVSAAGLAPGRYDGAVALAGPAGLPGVDVPVQLTVTAAPQPGTPSLPVPAPPAPAPPRPTPSTVTTVELAIATGSDDAREETANGNVRLDSQLFHPGGGSILAYRFLNVPIPRGARIVSATLWTYAVLEGRRHVRFRYTGEAAPDSAPFGRQPYHLSTRPRTQAFVDEEPGEWVLGDYNASADLAAIVEEIVGLPGWQAGHSLTVFMADSGSRSRRRIAAFESQTDRNRPAILEIEWAP